jgi:hypothetical protein
MTLNAQPNVSLSQAASKDYRDSDSFAHQCTIQVSWGSLDLVIDWCKTELVSDWRWQVQEMSSDLRPGSYIFYFDSDRDFCAFVMQWN